MIFPALLDAGEDPAFVKHRTLAVVYLYLLKRLDFQEYRRLRISRVSEALRMKPATVGADLRILQERGYLDRGVRVLDVFTYRLLYSRPGVEEAPAAPPRSQPAPQRKVGLVAPVPR